MPKMVVRMRFYIKEFQFQCISMRLSVFVSSLQRFDGSSRRMCCIVLEKGKKRLVIYQRYIQENNWSIFPSAKKF